MTPFDQRFGGWYVTGNHGAMRHRGNAIADDSVDDPIDPEPGANLSKLDHLIRVQPYLEPGSDLVSLMLLEYQSQMHNVITRASYESRRALHYDSVMNAALDREPDFRSDVTQRRISSEGDRLLRYSSTATNTHSMVQSKDVGLCRRFSAAVHATNRDDARDFDLKTRMFRYPQLPDSLEA